MNSQELIDILFKRIGDGFTFPLNPKWIFCNSGWKQVYDKLMASNAANVQASMDIWYPEDIRSRIHKISTKFPQGFIRDDMETSHISSVSVDLAKMELERYAARSQGRKKMKNVMLKRGRGSNDDDPTIFSAALQMLSKEVITSKQNDISTSTISTVPEVVDERANHGSNFNGDKNMVLRGEFEQSKNGTSQLVAAEHGSEKEKLPVAPEQGSKKGSSFSSLRQSISWKFSR